MKKPPRLDPGHISTFGLNPCLPRRPRVAARRPRVALENMLVTPADEAEELEVPPMEVLQSFFSCLSRMIS